MSTVRTDRLVSPASLVGQRVRVHLNLHRGDWTISDPTKGHVLCNVDSVTLRDVTFRVSESMRQRVIANHRRKVHAWAFGTMIEPSTQAAPNGGLVSYNPFRGPDFTLDGVPVHSLPLVTFTGRHGHAH